MAYEPKPGDISVFKNDRKEKDTHPDYRITGLSLDGAKIKGALWLKKDRNGNTYMSGKIEPDTYQAGGGDDFRSGGDEGVAGRRGGGGGADTLGGGAGAGSYDLNDQIPF